MTKYTCDYCEKEVPASSVWQINPPNTTKFYDRTIERVGTHICDACLDKLLKPTEKPAF